MSDNAVHFEEFLYLPALTHEAAIVAWGGFFFEVEQHHGKEKFKLLDVDKVGKKVEKFKGVKEFVGENSQPYGSQARVEVTGADGDHTVHVAGDNCAVVVGLKPDTVYQYRVFVTENDVEREWAAGTRRDWVIHDGDGSMQRGGHYDNTFRTFPDPAAPAAPFSFVVIGDFGRSVRKLETEHGGRCQRRVAEAIAVAATQSDARFIVTTGDNIYAKNISGSDSGDEDDDWFFNYFQPYRYLLNRMPVFPAVGNHDGQETENPIDGQQIYDNLYLRTQFNRLRSSKDCSMENGLFYRFVFGRDVQFICLDTSKDKSGERYFDMEENAAFIAHCFAGAAPPWRIVFSHHPAYCAGPRHSSAQSLRRFLLEHPEVRVSFSGHEHNFQYARDAGQHHFLTGGAGQFDTTKPSSFRLNKDKCAFWGGTDEGHFLLVTIRDEKLMEVTPFGYLKDRKLNPIVLNPAVSGPFLIEQIAKRAAAL